MEEQAGAGSAEHAADRSGATVPTATRSDLLTFVIADIRGYSTFTRERGDAAAAILAQRFADLARDAVEARGGRVLELRGDEAFAVFDSAAQAVGAAIDVQATFAEESRSDPAFQLPVGIGIDAGEAVPVEEGYRGVAVNMAARLCSSAVAGQVLVTRTVVDRADTLEDITFADRGLATFKGFEEPVEVIEAFGVAHASAVGGSPDGTGEVSDRALPPDLDPITPLVDREREMRWLRGTWRQVRRGHGRILLVSGPAQIGKTRLAADLASFVRADGANVLYSGQGGTGTALAMSAIRDATRAPSSTLLVLDDVDVAGPPVAAVLEASRDTLARVPVLVMGLLRDPASTSELVHLIDRVDERGDGHRVLGPLELENVREIARLYVGDADAPFESFARVSGGIPGRVHEVVSDWMRDEASRRLEAAAEFLAKGRERHASDLEFANNAIALKLGRLYTVAGRDVVASETCPYKGLAQFVADDADHFFGRERLVGELAARTVGSGFLGIVGASGSGKSSAVAAGLVPSLRAGLLPGSERWTHVAMRPGEHPMAGLLDALSAVVDEPFESAIASIPPDERLVMVVDQFEETFTTCRDENERTAFVQALTEAATRWPESVAVIAVVRGDLYAHSASYAGLADLLASNHVLVGPLTREELRRAIELPARRVGLRIESSLVDTLVEEVADEPGGLPLLSTALVELWQAREDGWIRMRAYDRTGGVHGAVARLAETSYAQLSELEQAATRRVFLRLVIVGDDEAIAKRRVPLSEFDLPADEAAAAVIERLTRDRLLTVSDGSVELSHEALLREWPRLGGWLEADVQGRQLHHHLMEAAGEWSVSGKDPADLYRGARLASAIDWTAEHTVELNAQERVFLERSREAREEEVHRTRRTNRRLKGSLIGVALFLVVALVGGSLAVVQRGHARHAATVADARQVAAQALADGQPLDRSLLLALAAVHLDDSLGSRSALLASLLNRPEALAVFQGAGQIGSMAITPDGRILAAAANTGDTTGEVFFFDTATHQQIGQSLQVGRVGWNDGLAISPDGRTLAVVPGAPATLDLIDISTHAVLHHILFPEAWMRPDSVAFSPDDRYVAVDLPIAHAFERTPREEDIAIYDVATGARVDSFPICITSCSEGTLISYAEGGSRIVAATYAAGAGVWDLRSHRKVRSFGFGESLAVAPDGESAAITHSDGTISLVNLASGHILKDLSGRPGDGFGLAFGPDGKRLAATSYEARNTSIWDVGTGSLVDQLSGHVGHVWSPIFSSDGDTLYTSGDDGRVIAWDMAGDLGFAHHLTVPTGGTNFAGIPYALSADGELLATSRDDGKIDLWHMPSLEKIATLPGRGAVALSFSPDGSTLATGTPKGRFILWDVRTATRQATWDSGEGFIDGLSYSPDGSMLAAGVDDKRDCATDCSRDDLKMSRWVTSTELWDPASHRLIHAFPLRGSSDVPVFSPDGRYLVGATCCSSGSSPAGSEAAVWQLSDYQRLFSPKVSGGVWIPAFSPDSRVLAVPDLDGSVAFYDVPSGAAIGQPLSGLNEGIENVSFSPDGTTLSTASNAGNVLLWDLSTRQTIGAAFTGIGTAALAQFTPDGRHLLATFGYGNGASAIYLWDVDLASWALRACSIAGRNLTPAEWSQYLPDRPYEALCPA